MPHPQRFTRRTALQAGSIGLLGLGLGELSALRSQASEKPPAKKSVIFVFLTGGLSHQDSFDLKPDAPESVRGDFKPAATRTPGMHICEHLPMLAEQSERYTLVRSLATGSNGHEIACHMLLTGRLDLPAGFDVNKTPSLHEWPSIPAQVTYAAARRGHLPPAAVLPEPSINEAARVRPGQYAGLLGPAWEAWHLDVASKCPLGNGACPFCFRHDLTPEFRHAAPTIFQPPMLTLPEGGTPRLDRRVGLLRAIERQQHELESAAETQKMDRNRQRAISMLADPVVRDAFDIERTGGKFLERYGRNKFGMSLLMARRLVEAGVSLVQVNLGKNSSWDTHRRNFVNLKDNLFPYFDRAVSALIDDLHASGLLDSTLVVVTGEFGRTPKINKDAGRDHWAGAMTALFAGGGVKGGRVIGATDRIAGEPVSDRQTPENLAATIFETLGIPRQAKWKDVDGRPFDLYSREPITGLS